MKAIVAVDENWAIGHEGELLCRISADLKRFKALTLGHPLILSRDPSFQVEGGEVFSDIPALLAAKTDDSIVIGGGSIYRELLVFCDLVYVTKVLSAFPADVWFPDLDAAPEWEAVEEGPVLEEKGLRFRYVTYRRR